MSDLEMREAVRNLMAGYEAMQLKRAGHVIPGITDSPLVAEVERLDAMRVRAIAA